MAEAIVPSKMKTIPENNWFDESEVGYMSRAFILASMPHSKPKEDVFVRKNGNYTLTMTAPPAIGLPYGSIPRLVMAWITTEAVRTKSRTINLGKNLSEFLEIIGLTRQGRTINLLKEQMKRLLSTVIYCAYEDGDAAKIMPIGEKYRLWRTFGDMEEIDKTVMADYGKYSVTLGGPFYDEISRNPVPVYFEALKILKKSTLALDVYSWLTHKMSYTSGSVVIPWGYLQDQSGSDYPKTPLGKRHFKAKFIEAVKKVETVYPEAGKLQVVDDGLLVLPGKPHVPKLEGKETAV